MDTEPETLSQSFLVLCNNESKTKEMKRGRGLARKGKKGEMLWDRWCRKRFGNVGWGCLGEVLSRGRRF